MHLTVVLLTLLLSISFTLCHPQPATPPPSLTPIPQSLFSIFPTYQITTCTPTQTTHLHTTILTLWTSIARTYIDLTHSLPSPSYTTFFKSPASAVNVSTTLYNLLSNAPAPKPLSFHCITDADPGLLAACRKLDATSAWAGTQAGIVALCPHLFDFPAEEPLGRREYCPAVDGNQFVVSSEGRGGFPVWWGKEILGIMLLVYVRHAAGLFAVPDEGEGGLLTATAGQLGVGGDISELNKAVGRSVEESLGESHNYFYYVLCVLNGCTDFPDIRLPPWSFSTTENKPPASVGPVAVS